MPIKKLCNLHHRIRLVLLRPIIPMSPGIQCKFIDNSGLIQFFTESIHLRGRNEIIQRAKETNRFGGIVIHVVHWAGFDVPFRTFLVATGSHKIKESFPLGVGVVGGVGEVSGADNGHDDLDILGCLIPVVTIQGGKMPAGRGAKHGERYCLDEGVFHVGHYLVDVF